MLGRHNDEYFNKFIRSVKVPNSSGTVHEHACVLESVRENGQIKQRTVLNLGRRDNLEAILPLLLRFLNGGSGTSPKSRWSCPSAGCQHLGADPRWAAFSRTTRPLAAARFLSPMAHVRDGLEKLETRVARGQMKDPSRIGAAAQRVLSRNHGHRYYEW